MYFADKSPSSPITTFDVTAYNKFGVPESIKSTYHQSGKPYRIEEYSLIGSKATPGKSPSDVFAMGQFVIDERLGTAPNDQVSYVWTGKLPSISELVRMRDPFSVITEGSPTRFILPGLMLLVGGIWLFARRKAALKPA